MLDRRKNLLIHVTRRSSRQACATMGPSSRTVIVRNLKMRNSLALNPLLLCRNMIGPGLSSLTATAAIINSCPKHYRRHGNNDIQHPLDCSLQVGQRQSPESDRKQQRRRHAALSTRVLYYSRVESRTGSGDARRRERTVSRNSWLLQRSATKNSSAPCSLAAVMAPSRPARASLYR